NVVFVGTENNALFRSVDGGKTWEWIRKGFWHNERSYPEFYDIVIDPDDESLMYAVLTNGPQTPDVEKSAGFYRSRDGGDSWERFVDGLPNTGTTSVAMAGEKGARRIFVGLDGEDPTNSIMKIKNVKPLGGIYFSEDEGVSWKTASVPEKGVNNRYSHIVVRGSSVFASGHRFTEEIPGAPRNIDIKKTIGLIRSVDEGMSWEVISPVGVFPYYFDVSMDGNVIYFSDGVSGNGYKSPDGGETWKKTNVSFSNVIRISPYNSDVAIFANGNQLFKTEDGLATQKRVFRIQGRGGFDDIEFTSDPNVIYAAGDGYRVYKSVDGGENFFQTANLREWIEDNK
ncbi:WD40/YVTN/BNR-like repeat-containing protein, partial [Patescibacteria group bacterium]